MAQQSCTDFPMEFTLVHKHFLDGRACHMIIVRVRAEVKELDEIGETVKIVYFQDFIRTRSTCDEEYEKTIS